MPLFSPIVCTNRRLVDHSSGPMDQGDFHVQIRTVSKDARTASGKDSGTETFSGL